MLIVTELRVIKVEHLIDSSKPDRAIQLAKTADYKSQELSGYVYDSTVSYESRPLKEKEKHDPEIVKIINRWETDAKEPEIVKPKRRKNAK